MKKAKTAMGHDLDASIPVGGTQRLHGALCNCGCFSGGFAKSSNVYKVFPQQSGKTDILQRESGNHKLSRKEWRGEHHSV